MAPHLLPCSASVVSSALEPGFLLAPSACHTACASRPNVEPSRTSRLRASLAHCNSFFHSSPLDSRRQENFCGCFDRRSLLPSTSSSSSLDGPSQRGGCGAASMSFSGYNDGRNDFEREEYIEAHVIEAVRMVPSREHLYMTMADGSEVEVEHVNPSAGKLLYLNSMPTIFLRMADSTNLLLPIVVGDLAIGFLMKAFKQDGAARPNYYELMKDLADSLQSEIKHVKITQRVGDTYYARIYLAKPGSSNLVSVDARPSDAVNLAVRAQVPIFVSKAIVHNDAVRVVYDPAKHGPAQPRKIVAQSHLDRGSSGPDDVMEEIVLIKKMQDAAAEERYADAAALRDQLNAFRMRGGRTQLNRS